jgi:hypothetical protein
MGGVCRGEPDREKREDVGHECARVALLSPRRAGVHGNTFAPLPQKICQPIDPVTTTRSGLGHQLPQSGGTIRHESLKIRELEKLQAEVAKQERRERSIAPIFRAIPGAMRWGSKGWLPLEQRDGSWLIVWTPDGRKPKWLGQPEWARPLVLTRSLLPSG